MSDETESYRITDEEIAEFIALTLAATGGEWKFGHHLCENLAEAEEWAVTMLRQRPERFDLQLVVTTVDGEEVSPAFCGNGYNAENNAKYISWASPSNIRIILLAMHQDRERIRSLAAHTAGLVAALKEAQTLIKHGRQVGYVFVQYKPNVQHESDCIACHMDTALAAVAPQGTRGEQGENV